MFHVEHLRERNWNIRKSSKYENTFELRRALFADQQLSTLR
jgi:hypothetical protein